MIPPVGMGINEEEVLLLVLVVLVVLVVLLMVLRVVLAVLVELGRGEVVDDVVATGRGHPHTP